MPTPKAGYRVADGTRVPSVTTILAKFKEAGGLMHWAWQLGIDGKDYRQVRDDAATAGTLAHSLVEQWIKKAPMAITGEPDIVDKAKNAFEVFVSWADQSKLDIVESEVMMVSEKHRFGGTLDAMGMLDGKLSLLDWKTSNRIYAEYLLQLAGYAILWEENFPERPIQGGYHLLRFAKETPDFSHHFWAELDEAKRGFLIMRDLYSIKANLEKRAS